jgi:hypothetical protein
MPLNKRNTRGFHRTLYAGMLESFTLLKRDDNQRQNVVTKYVIHQIRPSRIHKTGQTIQGDMSSDHRRTLHVPKVEMDRLGINHFNPLDRFIDKEDRWWQPESGTMITEQLFENHVCVHCLRVDPPKEAP